jgi:zinc/manganese transport system substrate-binding protein
VTVRHPFRSARLLPAVATAALAVVLVGCSSGGSAAGSSASAGSATSSAGSDVPTSAAGEAIPVVASTNVYASIVSTIGGDKVSVTAIMSDPSADPHSYEATPRTALEISKAKFVVANGGGYDDFVGTLVDASPNKPKVLDAVQISGLPTGPDFNEHVFYDLDSMIKLGNAIAAELGAEDAADAATFTANAKSFADKLTGLRDQAAAIGKAHPGTKAVVTEPVADYLLEDAGIEDVTPGGFSEAVEAETDPAAKDVAAMDKLISDKTVAVLIFNEQTSGPVVDGVRKTAETASVPVVGVTETLPAGVTDYATWIGGSITALSGALGSA